MHATMTASVRLRWWLRWYLAALVSFARATGKEPNWDRVEWWTRRGLVIRAAEAGQ